MTDVKQYLKENRPDRFLTAKLVKETKVDFCIVLDEAKEGETGQFGRPMVAMVDYAGKQLQITLWPKTIEVISETYGTDTKNWIQKKLKLALYTEPNKDKTAIVDKLLVLPVKE